MPRSHRLDGWPELEGCLVEGNKLGSGLGSIGSYATEIRSKRRCGEQFAIEAYYDYQVTDNITITPAVFWTDDANGYAIDGADTFGALVQTTFKF